MKIELYDFEKETLEDVKIPEDELDELGLPARNVARVYKALANGKVNCTFEDAVERHEFIAELYRENGWFQG